MRRARYRTAAVAASLALAIAATADTFPAAAARHRGDAPAGRDGYDIGFPQCNGRLPGGAAFGIVGVNGGIVYSPNPCLAPGNGPSELSWAIVTGQPQFYANTADPGPAYSSYWAIEDWASHPEICTTDEPNSLGCSYDYGWYAAKDSFEDAVSAEQQVGLLDIATATAEAATAPWWLDVETGNSWQSQEPAYSSDLPTAYANDTAALRGAADYLASQGVGQVGFYSTASQWDQITGGARFAEAPDWVAGFTEAADATADCGVPGFSGGPTALTQHPSDGFDADHPC